MTIKETLVSTRHGGHVPSPARATSGGVVGPPPLESGDRLTRWEFERRYNAMPHIKKAEFIEGVVSMPSPVRFAHHATPHVLIVTWLGTYCAGTPGVKPGDNATVRLDMDNDVQPDALLQLDEARGGQSRISVDDYVEGAPELIVEIASSSASYDPTSSQSTGAMEYRSIWCGRSTITGWTGSR